MIFIIGISLALFLELLLLSKSPKNDADKILALWLLAIGLHLLLSYVRRELSTSVLGLLIGLEMPFPLLHGPFLYLYVASVTNQFPNHKIAPWLHFIPFVVSFVSIIPFILLPAETKIEVFLSDGKGYEFYSITNFIAIVLSGFTYIIVSLHLLRKHKKNINSLFSNTENKELNWLRFLIYGLGIIWIVVASVDELYIFTSVTVFVLLTGFFGIRQPGIFTSEKEVSVDGNKAKNLQPQEKSITERYQKSGLTTEIAERIYNNLNTLMKEQKAFKESNLTLSGLANKINTQPNYLSQVINEKTGNNFYTYINNLRIEEFIHLLALPENKNEMILSLAYDCGFNSKSSFNKYFKEATGKTPSEYYKSLQHII